MLLSKNVLLLYSANIFYEVQPNDGYAYRLSAIDSSGREVHTSLNVKFAGPLYVPNYVTTIVSIILTLYRPQFFFNHTHGQ